MPCIVLLRAKRRCAQRAGQSQGQQERGAGAVTEHSGTGKHMNNKKYDGQLYSGPYIETLKDLVTGTVGRYPDRTAYLYKDTHKEEFHGVTYQEFEEMRWSLGTELIRLGYKGSKIAVLGDNSHRWALSYWTVVCGVGVIVPIDKSLELEEMINLLQRADVELLFCSAKIAPKILVALDRVETLKQIAIMASPLDNVDKLLEDERVTTQEIMIRNGHDSAWEGNRSYIDAEVGPEDLSTILFTSGTTGLAKGVMLSHRNLAQNVFNMSKYLHIPDGGRVLSVLPIHHAYECTCTIMTTFYQGATVVICEGLKYIQTNFLEAKCCIMLGVPLIYENLYRKLWKQAEKSGQADVLRRGIALSRKLHLQDRKFATKRMFSAIQDLFGEDFYIFIAGGAAIDPKVIDDFEAMGMPMFQGYGMMENAPIIAMNSDRYRKSGAAGKAMPGTEIRIVDQDENGIGEIICKGPSVMMGYYKDPESTAAVLRDGWLYTGDYGYLDDEGFLYITGRKKNVIVTKGGKNIFPEEVEYYLLLDPTISEALVYGKPEEVKGDLICTAIVYPDYGLLREKGITEDRDVYEEIRRIVEEANEKMPTFKRVKRIEVRDKPFIKTTTLKIKRFEQENFEYAFDAHSFTGEQSSESV